MTATKVCSVCQEDKARSAFSPDGRRRDGLYSACRSCRASTQREARQQQDNRTRQGLHFKSRYGITIQDYDRMFAEQDGKCAACGDTPQHRLHVDHDHDTGAVRGLLCAFCNKGLGCFQDDPNRLLGAAAYLMAQRDVLKEATCPE
ncbi:endonuclease VII domain-containing protein [Streptomyces sp. DSM 42041]|uniref:Endonuclease VII domain-containing protein n=1 Tax=Streptomyces hazeniae TaxID=3075538 RepID=A0ABU2NZ07_9ACTN|nr:endonuclease VII domain-containing protein [Streptomyces sp. DSM 42041]MDT0381443.1 endonuclease VII domain-containing protein [Streptomyces sp. DSM 42041]